MFKCPKSKIGKILRVIASAKLHAVKGENVQQSLNTGFCKAQLGPMRVDSKPFKEAVQEGKIQRDAYHAAHRSGTTYQRWQKPSVDA